VTRSGSAGTVSGQLAGRVSSSSQLQKSAPSCAAESAPRRQPPQVSFGLVGGVSPPSSAALVREPQRFPRTDSAILRERLPPPNPERRRRSRSDVFRVAAVRASQQTCRRAENVKREVPHLRNSPDRVASRTLASKTGETRRAAMSDSIDDVFEAHSAGGNAAALDAFLAFSFAASAAASAAPSVTPAQRAPHIGQFADPTNEEPLSPSVQLPAQRAQCAQHILIEAQFASKKSVYTAQANLVYV